MNLLSILILLFFPAAVVAQNGSDVKSLITELFTTNAYDKKVRPLTDQSNVMTISLNFYLNAIIGFDEQEESLTTSGYLNIIWIDEYLTWTTSDYGGLGIMFLPQDDIWRPDLSLRNSYKTFTGLGSSYLNLNVQYTGMVEWNPFQVLKSTCSLDITFFPFDQQKCEMKFTAWSYRKTEVELNIGSVGILLDDYVSNSAWDLVDTSAFEVNTNEAAVVFVITLERKPRFYLLNIVAPVILLTILNIFTFILPINSGERASYAITVFLSLAVFLTIVAAVLPQNSEKTSLLGVYLMGMASLSTVIVVLCLFQSRLCARDTKTHPINRFYFGIYKLVRKLLCKDRRKSNKIAEGNQNSKIIEVISVKEHIDSEDTHDEVEVTWLDICTALDVLFFIFGTTFTFLCTVITGDIAYGNK